MRWLIRRVTRKGKGAVSYEEDTHYGDVLTIGRGADQAIFVADLRVALEHARVTAVAGGKYRIESLLDAGVRVGKAIVHQDTVGPGEVVEIGSTRIKLLDAPQDYDAGVEIQSLDKTEMKAESDKKKLSTQLSQTGLSKRRPAWIAFLGTALFAFALPLAAHFVKPLHDLLLKVPGVPSQNAWQAGELAAAHHYFGETCITCHEKPFIPTRDEACLTCHGKTQAHADPAKFNLPELGNARCAHCHADHNGPNGLVQADQVLCSNCHRNLKDKTKGATQLIDVGDFGDSHPEFQINLPQWNDQGKFAPTRSLWKSGLKERSGLTFTHDKHLDPKGINSPDGTRKLQCAACHEPEPGGGKMLPINFEKHCQSCHKLTFSIVGGDREVQHGKVSEVTFTIDDFYSRLALEGGITEANAPMSVQTRRRPGQSITPQERQEALTWARDKARQAVDNMFSSKACTTCHQVFQDANQNWDVKPVRVAGVWFQKAHFTHQRHTTFDCVSCHQAQLSKDASDLLIPGIDNCKQCHAGEHAKGKVASTCVACHGYHESEELLSSLQARGAPAAPPPTPEPAPAPASAAPKTQ